MKFKSKISFLSIAGVIVPFGALWLPFLVQAGDASDKRFRKNFFWLQLVVALIGWLIASMAWYKEIGHLEAGEGLSGAYHYMLAYGVAVLVIGLIFGFYHLLKKPNREAAVSTK